MSSKQELTEKIDLLIADNKVMIFSKSACPFCHTVKKIFDDLKEKYFVVELEKEDDGRAMQDLLAEKTGQRTVPNVFINGKHVGGCSDVQAAQRSGFKFHPGIDGNCPAHCLSDGEICTVDNAAVLSCP